MKPVRVRTAVLDGVASALVLGVLFQVVINNGSGLPQHSWWEGALVAIVVAALLSSGWRIRSYVDSLRKNASRNDAGENQRSEHGSSALAARGELPSPDTARRTLVLAQAASLGGAVLAGWYLAQIGAHVQRWSGATAHSAVALLAVLAGEAIALSAVGFIVQKWCTLPEDQR